MQQINRGTNIGLRRGMIQKRNALNNEKQVEGRGTKTMSTKNVQCLQSGKVTTTQ